MNAEVDAGSGVGVANVMIDRSGGGMKLEAAESEPAGTAAPPPQAASVAAIAEKSAICTYRIVLIDPVLDL